MVTSKPWLLSASPIALASLAGFLQRADRVARCCRSTSARRGAIEQRALRGGRRRERPAAARPAACGPASAPTLPAMRAAASPCRLQQTTTFPPFRFPLARDSSREPREARRMHGVDQLAFERQRLAFQFGGDQLRGKRRPDQPARAVGERSVDAVGDLSDHRQPIRCHRAEGNATGPTFSVFDFYPEDSLQPLQVAGVAFGARRGIVVVDVVARADHAHALDRRQHHAAAQHDHVRRVERVSGTCVSWPRTLPQPQVRHRLQLRRFGRVGQDDDRGLRKLFELAAESFLKSRRRRPSSCASHQARGSIHPACGNQTPGARHRHARVRRSLLARHVLRVLGRQPRRRPIALRGVLLRVARELQHPARVPPSSRGPSIARVKENPHESAARRCCRPA